MKFLNNPATGKPHMMTTLVVITVLTAVVKFLLDGITMHLGTHSIEFGHMDALSYATLLAPVIGAHGYLEGKQGAQKDDNQT